MTRNPLLNALTAAVYIVVISLVMYYIPRYSGPEFTLVIPIAVLFLFTLSAAVMGYLFLYQPLQLVLDGERRVAVNLFLKTVAVFAGITLVVLVILFSKILS